MPFVGKRVIEVVLHLSLEQLLLSLFNAKKLNRLFYHKILTLFIALVWLVNGFVCKILNVVPRHEEIVAQILSTEYSRTLTILIGASEIIMAIWILSRFKPRLNAITQILVIASMNTLEFILVPELLLWGRWNAFFAFMLIVIIYYNEFILNKRSHTEALV